MPTASRIRVRRLEVADFSFVRDLAAKQPNFTIPPPYVLWLLLKIKGDVCLVAEHDMDGPVAYLLAVPIDTPADSLYVWQLAASQQSRRHDKPVFDLLLELHRTCRRLRIRSVIFSATPGSAAFRTIRRYLWKILSIRPEVTSVLPGIVAPNETEYRVEVK